MTEGQYRMSDPWQHRSAGMRCKTCMWFAPKIPNENTPIDTTADQKQRGCCHSVIINLGRCRRHAPTMNGYPVVFVNDWCGDHKLYNCEGLK